MPPIRIAIQILTFCMLAWTAVGPDPALSGPSHGLAMHGRPALPSGFHHLPYADPDAPKGGVIRYGVVGTFDSVNPLVVKSLTTSARGIWDPVFGANVYEPLLHRSHDEPFTLYGLIAETVETDADRTFAEFHIRPEARFSDGMPLTRDDVIFSLRMLGEKGRPLYRERMKKVAAIKKIGDRGLRLEFNERGDRELSLLLGMMPILPKHATNPETFDQSTFKKPVGSGPYIVEEIDPGRRISYRRNPDYWAKDLPIKRGLDNFDEIHVEYFRNESTRFEAFKKGLFDVFFDSDSARWVEGYGIAAVESGDIVRHEIARKTPAHMYGFVFNTRKMLFREREVRAALSWLFDFEWINANLFSGAYTRTASYWHSSELSSFGIPASDAELTLLESWAGQIAPEFLDGTYAPSVFRRLRPGPKGHARSLCHTQEARI